MKFTVAAKVFAGAMTSVGKIIERRNTYPILGNVHLTASEDGKLTIRGTDLDIEITVSIAADITAAGVTTVPAALLGDILKKLPKDAIVSFEEADGYAKVGSGRSKFSLAMLSADSFPDLKTGNFITSLEFSGSDLASGLSKVSFAISNEETRYYLNGVYMHHIERGSFSGVNLVATDGHRMAQVRRQAANSTGMPGIIIPKKTVAELIKLGEAAGETVIKMEISDSKIRVVHGDFVLLSKLIEGTFPDYERVTPRGNNAIFTADVKAMMGCVDRVSTVASDRGGKAVKLGFGDGLLTFEVSNPDHGTANDEMPIATDEGLAIAIGFNAGYLNDILNVIGRGNVAIALKDAGAPALLIPEGNEDELYVAMPMRV